MHSELEMELERWGFDPGEFNSVEEINAYFTLENMLHMFSASPSTDRLRELADFAVKVWSV